jgi:hypothetical protein
MLASKLLLQQLRIQARPARGGRSGCGKCAVDDLSYYSGRRSFLSATTSSKNDQDDSSLFHSSDQKGILRKCRDLHTSIMDMNERVSLELWVQYIQIRNAAAIHIPFPSLLLLECILAADLFS